MDMEYYDTSMEEDLHNLSVTTDFSDHKGSVGNNIELLNGNLIDVNCKDENYQRFIRIASAQEFEELDDAYASGDTDSFLSGSRDGSAYQSSPNSAPKTKEEEELFEELNKTEEEIATLRLILSTRIRRMQEIKRKLGITVWKEFKDDMEQGIRNIQESTAFQKTSQTIKTAGEKTSEALGSIGATVSKKLEGVKNSTTFKSIEEKVGSAYANVKTKVGGGPIEEGKTLEDALEESSREKAFRAEDLPDKH